MRSKKEMLDGQQIEERLRRGGKQRKRRPMDGCVFVCLCERRERGIYK